MGDSRCLATTETLAPQKAVSRESDASLLLSRAPVTTSTLAPWGILVPAAAVLEPSPWIVQMETCARMTCAMPPRGARIPSTRQTAMMVTPVLRGTLARREHARERPPYAMTIIPVPRTVVSHYSAVHLSPTWSSVMTEVFAPRETVASMGFAHQVTWFPATTEIPVQQTSVCPRWGAQVRPTTTPAMMGMPALKGMSAPPEHVNPAPPWSVRKIPPARSMSAIP